MWLEYRTSLPNSKLVKVKMVSIGYLLHISTLAQLLKTKASGIACPYSLLNDNDKACDLICQRPLFNSEFLQCKSYSWKPGISSMIHSTVWAERVQTTGGKSPRRSVLSYREWKVTVKTLKMNQYLWYYTISNAGNIKSVKYFEIKTSRKFSHPQTYFTT